MKALLFAAMSASAAMTPFQAFLALDDMCRTAAVNDIMMTGSTEHQSVSCARTCDAAVECLRSGTACVDTLKACIDKAKSIKN